MKWMGCCNHSNNINITKAKVRNQDFQKTKSKRTSVICESQQIRMGLLLIIRTHNRRYRNTLYI